MKTIRINFAVFLHEADFTEFVARHGIRKSWDLKREGMSSDRSLTREKA